MKNKLIAIFILKVMLLVVVSSIGVPAGVVDFRSDSGEFLAQSSVDWWPMFHHDLNHTGYSTSTAPDTNTTLWTYTTGAEVWSTPAVADGKVYVGSIGDPFADNVHCLNASTGQQIWSYNITNSWGVSSSPAVADNRVYFGCAFPKSNVYCLNGTTGEHIWNYNITALGVDSSPAVADGRVYVGSDDNKTYCLDAATGAHIWNFTTDGLARSSPAVVDGRVYVGSFDHNVYCLDAATGAHIWNFTTDGLARSSPAVVDGRVYVGSYDNKVYCLDAATGAHIWNFTTSGSVRSSPAIAYGMVYVGSCDYKVYCLNAATGAHVWNFTTDDEVYSSPAVADGKVYVGSQDCKVYCLNASTGARIWQYTTSGGVYSSPAVADGKVYVGSQDGKVYVFGGRVLTITTTTGGTTSPAPGTRTYETGLSLQVTAIPETGCVFDHWELDGGFAGSANPYSVLMDESHILHATFAHVGPHDVGVTEVAPSKTVVGQGYFTSVNVTIENQGSITETFNVTTYYNVFYDNFESGQKPQWTYHAENPDDSAVTEINEDIYKETPTHSFYIRNLNGNSWGKDNGVAYAELSITRPNLTIPYTIEFWFYPNQSTYDPYYNWWRILGTDQDIGLAIHDDPDSIQLADDSGGRQIILPFAFRSWHKINYTRTGADSYVLQIDDYAWTGDPIGDSASDVSTLLTFGDPNPTFGKGEAYWDDILICSGLIDTKNVTNLPPGEETTITFTWNTKGIAKGKYTIGGFATPVLGEAHTADNTYIDGWVIVAMIGDITGPDGWPDGKCDIRDIAAVAILFGVNYPNPRYDPNCDLTGPTTGVADGKIDIRDIATVSIHYGEIDP